MKKCLKTRLLFLLKTDKGTGYIVALPLDVARTFQYNNIYGHRIMLPHNYRGF